MEQLTNAQAAERLGVQIGAVYVLRATRLLRATGAHHIASGEVERYLAAKRARKVPKLCECGMMVPPFSTWGHRRGTYHKHYKRIKKLLAQPCLTLDVIGKRLGVTREYVRQIANKINVAPGPRQTVCTLNRKDQRQRASLRAHLGKVICQAMTERELAFSGSTRSLIVNGKVCAVAKALHLSPPQQKAKVAYYHAGYPRGEWRFVIVQTGEAVYVVPRKWLGASIYIPVGRIENYKGQKQRDWNQWKDRWDLLQ